MSDETDDEKVLVDPKDVLGAYYAHHEDREALAQWMIAHSFSTGHGDTHANLLHELGWQIDELRQRLSAARSQGKAEGMAAERKRCAELVEFIYYDDPYANGHILAEAIMMEPEPAATPEPHHDA